MSLPAFEFVVNVNDQTRRFILSLKASVSSFIDKLRACFACHVENYRSPPGRCFAGYSSEALVVHKQYLDIFEKAPIERFST